MDDLLTQVLLWLLIGYIAWYVLKEFIPQQVYTLLGFLMLAALLVMAFIRPEQNIVSQAWSILSLPFRPLGFALLLLISVFPFRDMKTGTFIRDKTFWAILILLLSSSPATAYWFHQDAEQKVTALTNSAPAINGPRPIVLLGQNTTRPRIAPRPGIELTEEGDRLRYAARLYREQPGSSIIVAAARRPDINAPKERLEEANDIQTLLTTFGVPPEGTRLAKGSRTIHDSAQKVNKILKEQFPNTSEIVLVTSALDMHRAVSSFTQELEDFGNGAGIKVIPRATNFLTIQGEENAKRRFQLPRDLIPSERAMYLTSLAIQEKLVSIYYFLRGWLSPIV